MVPGAPRGGRAVLLPLLTMPLHRGNELAVCNAMV